MNHTYAGETIRYEVTHKNRTSIGLRMDQYGIVEVLAPKGTSKEQVHQVLEANWALIQQKLRDVQARMHGTLKKTYEYGETFLYLGKTYPISITHDETIQKDHVVFDGKTLHIQVKQQEDAIIRQALKRYYYQQCKSIVEKSIKSHQTHFKMKPRSVKIVDSNKNWGTCNGNLELTFNWKLSMAPQEVIDYVVVHEMCHMVHLNHDRSFWRLVGKIMPDYKEREAWLAVSSWRMTV
ncbi:M48 family metallopeptidase [Metabacillus indicus]|uniref:Zinc protease n=1 Tax=Metabacillus indicus TaxID=246786 RepID=A0A084H1B4_METID|nr:SprT family zinc-dependent metalloprotease [Metabacillus indicus]KEZ53376.1 zinc protease [Metabacillus indicus]